MNLNKVFLLGRLTADPELRNLPSGQSVCSLRIATNRVWNDRESGEKKQSVEFHNVVTWGKIANVASQYLNKGSLALIEGRLSTRSWDDPSGVKKYRTEIIAEYLQLGPKREGSTQQSTDYSSEKKEKENPSQEEIPTIEEGDDIDVNEIPY
jgi:single-strand DNA-binding protein